MVGKQTLYDLSVSTVNKEGTKKFSRAKYDCPTNSFNNVCVYQNAKVISSKNSNQFPNSGILSNESKQSGGLGPMNGTQGVIVTMLVVDLLNPQVFYFLQR